MTPGRPAVPPGPRVGEMAPPQPPGTMAPMHLSSLDLARLCGARIEGDPADVEVPLAGITTDSREVVAGGAFVAVPGEHMDGHGFVAQAIEGGATCALVDGAWAADGGAPRVVLRVDDTAAALRTACAARLAQLEATVIGITGSVGKTTAKEMVAHVLSGSMPTARTAGNLNTWTGIPLSVLRHDGPAAAFVVEMGMSARGEIADYCSFTHPRIGVLLNVGVSHIELLGSREAIADAKAELLTALPAAGVAVCNADDALVRDAVRRHHLRARVIWYGLDSSADVTASDVVPLGLLGTRFRLAAGGHEVDVHLSVPGRHLVSTACAAAAVALELGCSLTEVAARLHDVAPVAQRGTLRRGRRGARIIDDSYNSAPASLSAALDVLATSGSSERVAVIGDMLELGDQSNAAHDAAGREVARAATLLVAVGAQAQRLVDAAVAGGLPAERALVAADTAAAAALALAACSPAATVLVKASHGLHLERVVERLVAVEPV